MRKDGQQLQTRKRKPKDGSGGSKKTREKKTNGNSAAATEDRNGHTSKYLINKSWGLNMNFARMLHSLVYSLIRRIKNFDDFRCRFELHKHSIPGTTLWYRYSNHGPE